MDPIRCNRTHCTCLRRRAHDLKLAVASHQDSSSGQVCTGNVVCHALWPHLRSHPDSATPPRLVQGLTPTHPVQTRFFSIVIDSWCGEKASNSERNFSSLTLDIYKTRGTGLVPGRGIITRFLQKEPGFPTREVQGIQICLCTETVARMQACTCVGTWVHARVVPVYLWAQVCVCE